MAKASIGDQPDLGGYLSLLFFTGCLDALLCDESFQHTRVGVLRITKVQDLCSNNKTLNKISCGIEEHPNQHK